MGKYQSSITSEKKWVVTGSCLFYVTYLKNDFSTTIQQEPNVDGHTLEDLIKGLTEKLFVSNDSNGLDEGMETDKTRNR